jgi:hypothetical protein
MTGTDWFLCTLLVGVLSYGAYTLAEHLRYLFECRRNEKLTRWQRRAVIDSEARGFSVVQDQRKSRH